MLQGYWLEAGVTRRVYGPFFQKTFCGFLRLAENQTNVEALEHVLRSGGHTARRLIRNVSWFEDMSASNRDKLLAGDPEPLGVGLAGAVSDLLASGYTVCDVHESKDGRYEALLNREIDSRTARQLAVAHGLEIFADFDEYECQRGFGLLCQATGHHVNGPVSDGSRGS